MHDIVLARISQSQGQIVLFDSYEAFKIVKSRETKSTSVVASSLSRKIDGCCSVGIEFQFGMGAGLFFVNLTHARVTWEEQISIEKRPNLIGL